MAHDPWARTMTIHNIVNNTERIYAQKLDCDFICMEVRSRGLFFVRTDHDAALYETLVRFSFISQTIIVK